MWAHAAYSRRCIDFAARAMIKWAIIGMMARRLTSASQSAVRSSRCIPSGDISPAASGQCPAVLALGLPEQAAQIGQHPGPRLGPGEHPGDPGVHLLQAHRPVSHFGHQAIAAHPHTLLPALACSP
jgi:hypothetical protein